MSGRQAPTGETGAVRAAFDKSGRLRVYGIRRRFDGITRLNFRENALHFAGRLPGGTKRWVVLALGPGTMMRVGRWPK